MTVPLRAQSAGGMEFGVRIVSIDYYMARPIRDIDVLLTQSGEQIRQVPIVRIFGATPAGQKCCLHVHRAFPYLYVPLPDSVPQDPQHVQAYLRRLTAAIDRAAEIARVARQKEREEKEQRQRPQQQQQGAAQGSARGGRAPAGRAAEPRAHVLAASLVRARSVYGFEPDDTLFVKIQLLDPRQMTHVTTLLQSGAILGQRFQPFESHVPYLLQFKISYNLVGMGVLRLSHVRFRGSLPDGAQCRRLRFLDGLADHDPSGGAPGQSASPPPPASLGSAGTAGGAAARTWLADSCPDTWRWGSRRLPRRSSTCELECDGSAEDILNVLDAVRMDLADASPDDRLVESLINIWEDEKARTGRTPPPPPPDLEREPETLCTYVEDIRAAFVRSNETYRKLNPELFPTEPERAHGAPSQTPASQAPSQLLGATQAANRAREAVDVASPAALASGDGVRPDDPGSAVDTATPRGPPREGDLDENLARSCFGAAERPAAPASVRRQLLDVLTQAGDVRDDGGGPDAGDREAQRDREDGDEDHVGDVSELIALLESSQRRRQQSQAGNHGAAVSQPFVGCTPARILEGPEAGTPSCSDDDSDIDVADTGPDGLDVLAQELAKSQDPRSPGEQEQPQAAGADGATPSQIAPSQRDLSQVMASVGPSARARRGARESMDILACSQADEYNEWLSLSAPRDDTDREAPAAGPGVDGDATRAPWREPPAAPPPTPAKDWVRPAMPLDGRAHRLDDGRAGTAGGDGGGGSGEGDMDLDAHSDIEMESERSAEEDELLRLRGGGNDGEEPARRQVRRFKPPRRVQGNAARQEDAARARDNRSGESPDDASQDSDSSDAGQSAGGSSRFAALTMEWRRNQRVRGRGGSRPATKAVRLQLPLTPPPGPAKEQETSRSPKGIGLLTPPRSAAATPKQPHDARLPARPEMISSDPSPFRGQAALQHGADADASLDVGLEYRPDVAGTEPAQLPSTNRSETTPPHGRRRLRFSPRESQALLDVLAPVVEMGTTGDAEGPGTAAQHASAVVSPVVGVAATPRGSEGTRSPSVLLSGDEMALDVPVVPGTPPDAGDDAPGGGVDDVSNSLDDGPGVVVVTPSDQQASPEETVEDTQSDSSWGGFQAPVRPAVPLIGSQASPARALPLQPSGASQRSRGTAMRIDSPPVPETQSLHEASQPDSIVRGGSQPGQDDADREANRPRSEPSPQHGQAASLPDPPLQHTPSAGGVSPLGASQGRSDRGSGPSQPDPPAGETAHAKPASQLSSGQHATPSDAPQPQLPGALTSATRPRGALARQAGNEPSQGDPSIPRRAAQRQGWIRPAVEPPTEEQVVQDIVESGGDVIVYQEPFYSRRADGPRNGIATIGGLQFRARFNDLQSLRGFNETSGEPTFLEAAIARERRRETAERDESTRANAPPAPAGPPAADAAFRPTIVFGQRAGPTCSGWRVVRVAAAPPTYAEAQRWLREGGHGRGTARSSRAPVDGMDENTGKLVVGADTAGEMLGTPSGVSGLGADLTQVSLTQGRSGKRARSRAASQATQSERQPERDDGAASGDSEDSFKPPSPKYDQGTDFFFRTPALPSAYRARASTKRRRHTTEKGERASASADAARDGSHATGAATPPSVTAPRAGTTPSPHRKTNRPGALGHANPTVSQLDGPPGGTGATTPTPTSQVGFRRSRLAGKGLGMSAMCIEVLAECRGGLLPDPRFDAIQAVALSCYEDCEDVDGGKYLTHVVLTGPEAEVQATVPSADNVTPPRSGPTPEGAGSRPEASPGALPARGLAAEGASGLGPSGATAATFRDLFRGAAAAGAAMREQDDDSPDDDDAAGDARDEAAQDLFPGEDWADGVREVVSDGISGPASGVVVLEAAGEVGVLRYLVSCVRAMDPDVLMGFEIQGGSLGYLIDRAAALELPLVRELSRVPRGPASPAEAAGAEADEYGRLHQSGLHCTGRVILNLWRVLRHELKLTSYSYESCAAAVLRRRVPRPPRTELHRWFCGGPAGGRWRALTHLVNRARGGLEMSDALDLLGRTAELAKTFGIDFFSVLSRGSQYRVESMMLRLAHTQNYVAPSPSRDQVANQPAMEAIPLVMEPESRMYSSPVVVLDFQSLYPSMIIAYNLCFSTCLGRPAHYREGDGARLGILQNMKLREGLLQGDLDPAKLNVAPNGVAFAPPAARPGVLPRLLKEILDTRVMVKAAMSRLTKDEQAAAAEGRPGAASTRVLQRCMNARQFALKLIANVTYGYTAAGFSGRMPMAELADAIVQSGRETLENAIRKVNNHPKWRARVVYGDTDSMFVLLPGRSKEEAFAIGREIAEEVSRANPPPVRLKLEKVYLPCILQTKKRYVGMAFESPTQKRPRFDAKGIETVRRDACPAVVKMLEQTLRILFATKDLSLVRSYVVKQWQRILAGRVGVPDFVFCKEVRLGSYSARASAPPPAAVVAAKAMVADPRAEPRYAERVPYVVVYGEPGARLVDLVVPPEALVESKGRLRLHAMYYITKQILPALERVLTLVGADINTWLAAMPRPMRLMPHKRPPQHLPISTAPDTQPRPRQGGSSAVHVAASAATEGWTAAAQGLVSGAAAGIVGAQRTARAPTIDQYYLSRHCAACDGLTHAARALCDGCRADPQSSALTLGTRAARLDAQLARIVRICLMCGGGTVHASDIEDAGARRDSSAATSAGISCVSLDCPVYYERNKLAHEAHQASALLDTGLALLESDVRSWRESGS
ncbi:unnamed protein product [Pedinophyceae sp. YPF-701]|nr:unnamed protein product [Pedinophyceae sp. YPF-701]